MDTTGIRLFVLLVASSAGRIQAAPPGSGFPGYGFGGFASAEPASAPAGFSYDRIAEASAHPTNGGASLFESLRPTSPTPGHQGVPDFRDGYGVKSSAVLEQGSQMSPSLNPGLAVPSPSFDFNALFQKISPFSEFAFPGGDSVPEKSQPGIASSFEALQQSSASSGKSQGHRESMHDEGGSEGSSTDGKEVYSTKESFGHETSASHAIGAVQDSKAQSSESSRHENGHRIQTLSHGTNVLSPPIGWPSVAGNGAFPNVESNSTMNSQTLLASSAQDAFVPAPGASINGEKFSKGSKESSQTNSSNSSAYNVGLNDSKSFAHSESLGDTQAFVNGGANKHATQTQRGSESTQIDGSTSTNKFKETSFVQG